ncbi:HAMP domain-containing sensor histidine kinase [Rarobacter faecitabidus]
MGRRSTLRTQIVVLVVVLLALLSTVITAVSYFSIRSTLISELDSQLQVASSRTVGMRGPLPGGRRPPEPSGSTPFPVNQDDANQDDESPDAADEDEPGPGAQIPNAVSGGTIVVRVQDGEVFDAGYFDPATGDYLALTTDQKTALITGAQDRKITAVSVPGLGSVRAISRTNSTGEQFITAMPTAQVDSSLARYLALSAGVSLATLAGAGVIGTILVRRSLRPLARVAAAASEVAEMELSRGEVAVIPSVPVDEHSVAEADQVGRALNTMLRHVESSLNARHESETQVRQFVADASHELRTPLASIRGYAELVERSDYELAESTRRYIDRIHSESVRMGGLVEDMLLLARMDAGRPLEREPVDLTALAIDCIADAHAAGPDHTWLLGDVADGAVEVAGDEARLQQVLVNLLANARIHTPPGTTVITSVGIEGDEALIEVRDDGPGIDPAVLPRIFQRFVRADGARNRVGGSTGLGLAIVEATVKSHGGRIEVTSEPGDTRFTIHLPLGR